MPTYIVTAPQGRLLTAQKSKLAEAITRVHCDITGAPSYFAQVIFYDVPEGNYFVGGKALEGLDHVYLHGTIRAGRDATTKEHMLVELMKVVLNLLSWRNTAFKFTCLRSQRAKF